MIELKELVIHKKLCDNRNNKGTFHTGTLSFQTLQQIQSGYDTSFSINTVKCFLGKLGKNRA